MTFTYITVPANMIGRPPQRAAAATALHRLLQTPKLSTAPTISSAASVLGKHGRTTTATDAADGSPASEGPYKPKRTRRNGPGPTLPTTLEVLPVEHTPWLPAAASSECKGCYAKNVPLAVVCKQGCKLCLECTRSALPLVLNKINPDKCGTCPYQCDTPAVRSGFLDVCPPSKLPLLERCIQLAKLSCKLNHKKTTSVGSIRYAVECPHEGCGHMFVRSANTKKEECPKCKGAVCRKCAGPHLVALDCAKQTDIPSLRETNGAKRCYSCGTYFVKYAGEGCHHVECHMCGSETCAACGKQVHSLECHCSSWCPYFCPSCPKRPSDVGELDDD